MIIYPSYRTKGTYAQVLISLLFPDRSVLQHWSLMPSTITVTRLLLDCTMQRYHSWPFTAAVALHRPVVVRACLQCARSLPVTHNRAFLEF